MGSMENTVDINVSLLLSGSTVKYFTSLAPFTATFIRNCLNPVALIRIFCRYGGMIKRYSPDAGSLKSAMISIFDSNFKFVNDEDMIIAA